MTERMSEDDITEKCRQIQSDMKRMVQRIIHEQAPHEDLSLCVIELGGSQRSGLATGTSDVDFWLRCPESLRVYDQLIRECLAAKLDAAGIAKYWEIHQEDSNHTVKWFDRRVNRDVSLNTAGTHVDSVIALQDVLGVFYHSHPLFRSTVQQLAEELRAEGCLRKHLGGTLHDCMASSAFSGGAQLARKPTSFVKRLSGTPTGIVLHGTRIS